MVAGVCRGPVGRATIDKNENTFETKIKNIYIWKYTSVVGKSEADHSKAQNGIKTTKPLQELENIFVRFGSESLPGKLEVCFRNNTVIKVFGCILLEYKHA